MVEELYEIICQECGKSFDSIDMECTLCPECWEKIITLPFDELNE